MMRLFLLLLCVQLSQQKNPFCADWFPDWSKLAPWNGLRVKWGPTLDTPGAFERLPRTRADALKKGFVKVSSCGEFPYFEGNRYVKNGDTSAVLIFDNNGYIAGIQSGFTSPPGSDYPNRLVAGNNPFVFHGDKYYITAYFVEPSTICKTGRDQFHFVKFGTGNDLYIQNGTSVDNSIKIPHDQAAVEGSVWGTGMCFNQSMGVHYWYNVRKDMNCNEFFPVFLMYNKGKLNSFGWAFNGVLNEPRYEHPSPAVYPVFFKEVPDCLAFEGTQTTLHIYLTDEPEKNQC